MTRPARRLAPGDAEAPALVLSEPLGFWGGVDAGTGQIVDGRHPQHGEPISGRVLVMPAGRGSSSSSSVLAESIRRGSGPAAIVLGTAASQLLHAVISPGGSSGGTKVPQLREELR